MNLGEIRQRTNDRLNQAVGQFYPDDYLDRVINEAYRDISNEIDAMGDVRHPVSHDIAVIPSEREYTIQQYANAIIDVVRVMDDGTEQQVNIRPYSMRNANRPGWSNDCYVYRVRHYLYEWVVGTIAREPVAQTLRVYCKPRTGNLSGDSQDLGDVPPEYQDIIPVRAAMIVLEDENREIGNLAAIYVEKMDRMRRCLSGAVKGHASKPW